MMKVKVHTLDGSRSEPIYEGTFPDGFEDANGGVIGITEKISSIPLSVGNFHAKETWFNGVHIHHAEINLNQAIEVHIDAQAMPVVEMHFALNGRTDIDYRDTWGMPEAFKPLQHNIMYSPGFTGAFQLKPHTTDHRFFEVHLTESYFRELVDEECRVLSSLVTKMERKEMGAVSQRNLGMTAQMTRVV